MTAGYRQAAAILAAGQAARQAMGIEPDPDEQAIRELPPGHRRTADPLHGRQLALPKSSGGPYVIDRSSPRGAPATAFGFPRGRR